jgi:uncharacterized protein involved in exopolysaccharide biosynthesis
VATAIAGLFVLPQHYRAAGKVLLTSNRANISTSAARPTELLRTSQVSPAELNSQLEIVRSRGLIESVLTDMGAVPVEPEIGTFTRILRAAVGAPGTLLKAAYRMLHGLEYVAPATPLERLVLRILDATEASALKNTNVIEIAFSGEDPAWARDFVNRLSEAYVERQAKMQRETDAERFFTEQSEILRRKLTESEAGLRTLREKAGTLAGQQAEIHTRLNEFSAELARTKIARVEQEERAAYLERALGGSGRVASPELLALEAKRAELLGRYRPDSQRVREIDGQIQTLRNALSQYKTVTAGEGAGATTDLTGARAAVVALKGKEEALGRETEEYRRQATLLDAQSFDLARLERQVKLDEEAYVSYVRTAEESRLSNALQQSSMLRLKIVEPATLPTTPSSPKTSRVLVFALFGGLVASLGVGFARDHFDTTLKSASDVRRHGDLEVLAVLPERVA